MKANRANSRPSKIPTEMRCTWPNSTGRMSTRASASTNRPDGRRWSYLMLARGACSVDNLAKEEVYATATHRTVLSGRHRGDDGRRFAFCRQVETQHR